MSDVIELELSPPQIDIFDTDLLSVAMIGGKGSGKTWAGTLFVCQMIAQFPNSRGVLIWNTYKQSVDIWNQDIKPRLEELKWAFTFNEQKMVLRCNGCEIHLRSADLAVMRQSVESIQYHWGWGDEVSFWDVESFRIFYTRIRLTEWNGNKNYDPRIRVTSMPDAPDHWMYDVLQNSGFKIHEVPLSSNPNKTFVTKYTKILESIYDADTLKRYKNGDRISLDGTGVFYTRSEHRKAVTYTDTDDLMICWDFNNEYRAVTFWQLVGRDDKARPILGCVRSLQMKGETVHRDAELLVEMVKDHKGRLLLHGDASGENKTAAATDSMWKAVRDVFYEAFPKQLRFVVPSHNPPVKDTIECVNWALMSDLLIFDDTNATNAFRSLTACKFDKYGEIDKAMDNKPSGARTHEADTVRYAVWYHFQKLYPAGKRSFLLL